ncbi:heparan sulfate 2-O-sulfotransferase 1-like [Clytia hemisphaerica]|uniref:Uncharacterized protein n=1 Tax=Clytia hemisphaerica TaxID=252671 RepID=A0A7M5V526_9CNID
MGKKTNLLFFVFGSIMVLVYQKWNSRSTFKTISALPGASNNIIQQSYNGENDSFGTPRPSVITITEESMTRRIYKKSMPFGTTKHVTSHDEYTRTFTFTSKRRTSFSPTFPTKFEYNDNDKSTSKDIRITDYNHGVTTDNYLTTKRTKYFLQQLSSHANIKDSKMVRKSQNETNSNLEEIIKNNSIGKSGIIRFVGNISCDPIYPDVLLYNRIFKTGSTSISGYIDEVTNHTDIVVKAGTTEDWYKTGDPWPYPGHIEKYARISKRLAYIAHFFFRRKLKISKSFTYINIFREPVERVVSHYFYMRNEKLRPKGRIRELKRSGQWNITLLDCVRHQYRGCEDNVMTHFICGTADYCDTGSRAALVRAKRNLKRYYAAVGLLEEVQTFLKILKKRLPSFFIREHEELYALKKNRKTHATVDPTVLEVIRTRNKADVELYEYVREIYGQMKTKCGL